MKKIIFLLLVFPWMQGCAVLHHIQLGDIDNRDKLTLRPIEVKVSETGIDLNDVKALSRLALGKDAKNSNQALTFIQYFQMGPHTGNGVYSLEYIKHIQETLTVQCTDGFITGVMAIRETRKYPVISGEIIKIKAYCATVKGST
jgi:hypothetical protein